MHSSDSVVTKDLVLLGGGHSHVAVLRNFGMKPFPGLRITVVAREIHTPYSGMLPGFVAGLYEFDDIHIDLAPLTTFAGARLFHDEVVGLDLSGKRVLCRNRPPVAYDLLSIDTGATPSLDGVPGAAEHVLPVKPIGRFIPQWDAMRERILRRSERSVIACVGEGAGGGELLMAVEARLRREIGTSRPLPEYHLFARGPRILPGFPDGARRRIERIFQDRGIVVHTDSAISRVGAGLLLTEGGAATAVDEILWTTSAGAPAWPAESGLATDERGFIQVTPALRSVSHEDVFAVGDVAANVEHPRPKAGVFAVRQGRPLALNLRRALRGRPPKPFLPQQRFLTILGNGEGRGVATRNGLSVEGRWVWAWKDHIDRKFMRRFTDLPQMAAEPQQDPAAEESDRIPGPAAMRCGGCGAKVGSDILAAALRRVVPASRDDLVIGLGAADDAAVVHVPAGKLAVQTVDYFRAIVDDPYLFAQIAANHSLGDLYAMGAEPQSALVIATLPYGLEQKTEEMLFQLMTGANKVIGEAGAALAGGHTSEGAELAMGFAVNGLATPEALLRKGGIRPGDRLVLTKPLGTGTLFAAAMQGKAKGRWIDAALDSMLQSSRAVADCLRRFGATACTDVTGFGLAGHLLEMARPSNVDVELRLDALPALDGALETISLGIVSSLQPQNRRAGREIHDLERWDRHPALALLFDPQTAGGLLASVPEGNAAACVEALTALGFGRSAVIGQALPRGHGAEYLSLR